MLSSLLHQASALRDIEAPADAQDRLRTLLKHITRHVRTMHQVVQASGGTAEKHDLRGVAREALSMTQRAWEQSEEAALNYRFDIEAIDEPVNAFFDPSQVREVIVGMILRALGTMPTGGRACIGIGKDANKAWLEVCDQGPDAVSASGRAQDEERGVAMGASILARYAGKLEARQAASMTGWYCTRLTLPLANPKAEASG